MLGPWPCPRPRALLLSTLVVVFFAAATIATDCGSNHPDLTTGNNSCCTTNNLCSEGEGDCDSDADCAGAAVCGTDNCGAGWMAQPGAQDDCCTLFAASRATVADSAPPAER